MSELTDVLGAIESLSARGERLALATIVAVRGSTYRRPGARLLVPEEGAPIGNISGRCLENDVADVARIVMTEGHARVVSFDLTADDDGLGQGLGCNGAIELFVEPRTRRRRSPARSMALEEEHPIDGPRSRAPRRRARNRLLVRPDGTTQGRWATRGRPRRGRD